MVPFFTLEIMAGAIQALVFTMLSTVLIGMATTKMHH
jgi:F0F1-type ATP synthase membrane subunit a